MLLQEIKSSLFRQTLKMALRMASSSPQPSESGVEWFGSAWPHLTVFGYWCCLGISHSGMCNSLFCSRINLNALIVFQIIIHNSSQNKLNCVK